jgi:hypothetical protein
MLFLTTLLDAALVKLSDQCRQRRRRIVAPTGWVHRVKHLFTERMAR